jgi:YVTN family beta-propeller protein
MVAANRDDDSITVFDVDVIDGAPTVTKVETLSTGTGSDPWQVVVDGCSQRAYAVLREAQKVVEIESLESDPVLAREVSVGSEPTGLALSPDNTRLFVANWVEGTVSVIDTATMTVTDTVDLNATLAATGLLGSVTARPALAHPRSVAVTADGARVLVTEWFGQRTEAELANGSNADTSKKGLLYSIDTTTLVATTIDLPNVADSGFPNHLNQTTGCFPNQVGTVAVNGGFAYVTSTCASPEGPLGVVTVPGVCTMDSQCGLGGTCNVNTGACNANNTNVKTTTHPALTIVDLADGSATTTLLDREFEDLGGNPKRMPLLPSDVAVFDDRLYVLAQGTDAVFKVEVSGKSVTSVGSTSTKPFINVRPAGDMGGIRIPNGLAVGHVVANDFAFSNNEGAMDVSTIDLGTEEATAVTTSVVLPSGEELERLEGERFFVTGLGRWSLGGEGWGSCAACHIDGLSDNVTWYFARGPRQSTSLDGSYSKTDPTDQRVFNWTGIFDEMADFELNTRGVSGGLGAIVNPADTRINLTAESPPQQGLQGSTADVADPMGTSPHPHSVLPDWNRITTYAQGVRPPKRPVGLNQAQVDAGRTLFTSTSQGNCVGCHSGSKWTISTVFYEPGDTPNAATASAAPTSLSNVDWNVNLDGFPAALFPSDLTTANSSRMRFGAPPGAEQLQCILRPVGTFNVAPAAVGVAELRQDMTTLAQGGAATGRGYNPPSLLGMQVGAPFFHAGQARTLEEVLDAVFVGHHQSAIASTFSPTDAQKAELVQFLLSIDTETDVVAVPAKGATGGDLCFYP